MCSGIKGGGGILCSKKKSPHTHIKTYTHTNYKYKKDISDIEALNGKNLHLFFPPFSLSVYRSGSHFGSHRILGHITSRLPHQLTTKPRFYCVPTVFLYVFVEFVELTWHIRHDPKCENRWNFFFSPIFCHEVDNILTNGFRHFNRGFPKLQTLFYYF